MQRPSITTFVMLVVLVGSTNTDMKFNTPSGLHAALANVDILIDETYSAGAYTFSRALGKSQE